MDCVIWEDEGEDDEDEDGREATAVAAATAAAEQKRPEGLRDNLEAEVGGHRIDMGPMTLDLFGERLKNDSTFSSPPFVRRDRHDTFYYWTTGLLDYCTTVALY